MTRRATLAAVFGLVLLMPAGIARPPAGPGPGVPEPVAAAESTGAAIQPPGDSIPAPAMSSDSVATADSALVDSRIGLPGASPRDYLAEVAANFTPENRAYSETKVLLWGLGPVLLVLVMLLLLFSGLSARLRDAAHQLGHRRYVRVLAYLFFFTLITFVIALPFDWYEGFALEHQYGLSTQSLAGWFGDHVKGVLLNFAFVGVIPLVALANRAIARHPRSWWLWLAGGTVPVLLASVLFGPLVYEPMFNKVEPLSDPALRTEILDLAAKAGIPARQVYEADHSKQTRKFNAYVSGFGATQRIVLWDTTLRGMKPDEILFVMGHEMGHYRMHHVWKGVAFTIALSFLMCFLLSRVVSALYAGMGEHAHLTSLDDIAALPIFVIGITLVGLIAQPAVSAFSRTIEHEADGFAIEVTHDNDAGARAFLALASQNRNDPSPPALVEFWFYDHPPLAERIRYSLDYRPWERGEPNRFFRPRR